MARSHLFAVAIASVITVGLSIETRGQQSLPDDTRLRAVAAADNDLAGLRQIESVIERGIADGSLTLRTSTTDPMLPGHQTERFDQFYRGVPIWGAELVRDSATGMTVSVFGAVASELAISTVPSLTLESATGRLLQAFDEAEAVVLVPPALVVLPVDGVGFRLAYGATLAGSRTVERVFIDAHTGAELLRFSELQRQAADVGIGTGVLGDKKKLSVQGQSGTYLAFDTLRPPVIQTFDFRNNLARAKALMLGQLPFTDSDTASDTDNLWTDPAVVDAHAHVSWTYDYFYKRFGRSGLDGRNAPVYIGVNGVSQQGALSLSGSDLGQFALNAFWCASCLPSGIMYFGSGVPSNIYIASNGRTYTYFSGALDIAAHELTHAVTSNTSRLVYANESGALNEAFSDIMGKSVEFFYRASGTNPGQADYVLGKDISRALAPGALNGDRSMADPRLYGDPDHYSRRVTGAADNGGVHTNSGIANQAFYLAIEGGTNRTSGLSVQGVGPAKRDQIEKVYYRAFTQLMPSSGTFAIARAVTAQAARDLYGAGGPVEVAVTQAWSAVGVF